MKREQIGLPGMERTDTTPTPSAYTVVRCVCGTKVIVGRGVRAVGCPKCRQIVAGDLLGGVS